VIMAALKPQIILPRDKAPIYLANLAAYEGDLTSWKKYPGRKEESLSEIATKFNVSVSAIRQANDMNRGLDRLADNQIVIIPGPTTDVTEATARISQSISTKTYRVRRGDTLSGIARKHRTSVRRLREINGITGSKLSIGQRLKVPG